MLGVPKREIRKQKTQIEVSIYSQLINIPLYEQDSKRLSVMFMAVLSGIRILIA